MNPLTRQDTRPSIHSWWSDSNPGLRGPTINLHAVAKPLMRRMYHRQVLEFIRENCDSPLSRDVLETYSSYFPWDYVSHGTKIAILSELTNRTESDVEACAVVDSPVFYHIAQMLRWPDIETRRASCVLLRNLASHECTVPAILELNLLEQLVSLVGEEEDSELTQVAQEALCHIAQRDGAQAIVESPVLDHVLGLLESPRGAVRGRACDLVEKFAQHDSTLPAILKSKACVLLMSLWLDEDFGVAQSAEDALSCIAQRLEDAPAVDVKTLDHVLVLLESSNPDVKRWACSRMEVFSRRESTLSAMLESEACVRMMSLLRHEHPGVIWSAQIALSCISRMLDDAPAIVEKMLERVLDLIKSSDPKVRKWACDRVGGLARHESSLPAILGSRACEWLVSLLSDEHPGVIRSARNALSRVSQMLDNAPAIVSKVLNRIWDLIESPNPEVRRWACDRVGGLARHESTLPTILESKACVGLVSLLCDTHSDIIWSALSVLTDIARKLEGAQAIVKSKVLDVIFALLESSYLEVRQQAWILIGTLVCYESILLTVLESKAFVRLLSLLQDAHPQVVQSVIKALSQIAEKLDGAQAIVELSVLDDVFALLESLYSEVRQQTCTLIGKLVHHESILLTVLESKSFARLLSLLQDARPQVVQSVIEALSQIAEKLDGAQAIVELSVLDDIFALLESLYSEVRQQTCTLIGKLVHHKSILLTVLESKSFVRLLSLLQDARPQVVQSVIEALSQIAEKLDGAQAIVELSVLDDIFALLESSYLEIRQQTCTLIGKLVHHKSILLTVLESKSFARLLSLLQDARPQVVQSATKVLSRIAKKLEGAQAIVKAKALDNVSELIESSCWSIRFLACILIDALVHHESILPAILESKTCEGLMAFLLREATTSTYSIFALCALREISKWPIGAVILIDMPVMFEGLQELCQSSNYVVASLILDDLARVRSAQ
ncbi:hypothetical protein MVEN_00770500 [Mycena venus]|uniref:Uncharacterized protein n=1 Tax=Mycena venus TaxID=2733690 RepID=A0A8H6YKL6_9AGAR|nr:hypothetical protein MVEN_00770500 [Mycena venus]